MKLFIKLPRKAVPDRVIQNKGVADRVVHKAT